MALGTWYWSAIQSHYSDALLASRASSTSSPRVHRFGRDHVLGTSLDLAVAVDDPRRAEAAEAAVLEEVERLRRLLSTYDPASEISRLNATSDALRVSPELIEVLALYERWRLFSGGAFNGRLGTLLAAWTQAEAEGSPPGDDRLAALAREIDGPAAELDAESGTARRLAAAALNVDALGKNFILGRALRAARRRVPEAEGILLSIGGDLAACGGPWDVGVADPRRPFDNASPLFRVRLGDGALASSGAYERGFSVGGRRYPRLLDPRSGRPALGVLGASVLAPDPTTADALSTLLCVLGPAAGFRLLAAVPGAAGCLVTTDGALHASPGWGARAEAVEIAQQKASAWPAGFEVSIVISLAKSPKPAPGKPYRRPYVAVWAEDAAGRPVRTIAVWGNDPKHVKELTQWWPIGSKDAALFKAVGKATRDGGTYKIVWDGLDDQGKPAPPGVYLIRIEVNREFGQHIKDMAGALPCRTKPAGLDFRANAEVDGVKVRYEAATP